MEESKHIVDFGPAEDGRTYWVTRGGTIRSVEPGGQAHIEAQLEEEVLQATWCNGELLYRTNHSVERWSAATGNETVLFGLASPPQGRALVLHPVDGFFGTTLPRRAHRYRNTKTVIFEAEAEIQELEPCTTGDYLTIRCEGSLESFDTATGNSLGVMHDVTGGWILWDGLLVCQVDNPRGTGLMVVDLRESRLIQGGPSGYPPLESFVLSSGGDWLFAVSPSHSLIVGWILEDGCYPVPRWESRHSGLLDLIALPEGRLLVLKADGALATILDDSGDVLRQLPLHFRGKKARLIDRHTLAAIDGESLLRWNLQNGEGVAYS